MAEVHSLSVFRSARRQDKLMQRLGRYIEDDERDPSVLGLERIEKNILLGARWHLGQLMASMAPSPVPANLIALDEAIDSAVKAEIARLTALWAK